MEYMSTQKMENIYSQSIDYFIIKLTKMNLISILVGIQFWIATNVLLVKYLKPPPKLKQKMDSIESDTEREQIKYSYINSITSLKHSICLTIGTTYFVMNNDWVIGQEAIIVHNKVS